MEVAPRPKKWDTTSTQKKTNISKKYVAQNWWGLKVHIYKGLNIFCSSCVISSRNMTTYNNFVSEGDLMQQVRPHKFYENPIKTRS